MRTAIILGIGLALLTAFLGIGSLTGGPARMKSAALLFIAVWFVATSANLYIGVTRAGYSFMEELPIFLLLFGVPAVVALVLRYKL